MALNPKEKHIDKKNNIQKKRRSFLKKGVYAVPTLIVLGQLARPDKAMAADSWDPGPGDQSTWSGG